MNKKKGTHSTQKKYFNTIPKSEFYGVALGYAFGLILGGLLRLESQIPQLAAAVIGFGIGYFIDKKYYQEPDEPYEDPVDTDDADDVEDPVDTDGEDDVKSPDEEEESEFEESEFEESDPVEE